MEGIFESELVNWTVGATIFLFVLLILLLMIGNGLADFTAVILAFLVAICAILSLLAGLADRVRLYFQGDTMSGNDKFCYCFRSAFLVI